MPPPPPPLNGDMAAPGGNNSSDFVRKLYKMLEDPAYDEIVRWGNDGDSFVVLENEKFTKTILPKHFKHSNFASFVRQLNKYDFHKVRHTEDNGAAQYGQGVWEFKHPEFKANMKDNLDNIRRKAPAPRKQTTVVDDSFPNNQQVSLMNESLSAALQQVAGLQDHYYQVVATNKLLVEEVLNLQKTAKAQHQVHHELLNFLDNLDERRRNSKHANQPNPGQGFHSGGLGMLPDSGDEPAPELRRARETLLSVASAVDSPNFGKELERLSLAFQNVSSPPESTTSSTAMFPQQSLGMSMPMSADPFHDVKHLVYPMGQNQGIDPFHADHIHNIPYTQPPMSQAMEATSQITPPPPQGAAGQPSIWVKRPYILLVEDDKVCARIGAKFLMQYGCQVDTAGDGMEAVGLVNTDPNRYHLVFMDIIMPNLDGVSAATCIRTENHTGVPIVAMTSNIRQEDIATYFNFGMNDVLAKPFTKEGMIRILKKHLAHMYKNPQEEGLYAEVMPAQQMPTMAFVPGSSGGPMSMATLTANPAVGGPPPPGQAHSVQHAGGPQGHHGMKFDGSAPPMHSPSIKFEGGSGGAGLHSPSTTAGSWNSPGTMSQTSPAVDGGGGQAGYMTAGGGGGPMALTPGGSQRPGGFAGIMAPQVGTPPIPRMPDGQPDDRPEKRQRMYGGAAAFP